MRRTLAVHQLDKEQITSLLKESPARTFNVDETLVYENQVPMAGYILIEGKIIFEKKGRALKEVPLCGLICLKELLENRPVRHCVKIVAGSKAVIIDKSTALDLLKKEKEALYIAT